MPGSSVFRLGVASAKLLADKDARTHRRTYERTHRQTDTHTHTLTLTHSLTHCQSCEPSRSRAHIEPWGFFSEACTEGGASTFEETLARTRAHSQKNQHISGPKKNLIEPATSVVSANCASSNDAVAHDDPQPRLGFRV